MIPAPTWAPTLDEYHSDSAIGASMLSEFRSNRRLFYAHYVAKTLPTDPPTKSMRLGTMVHALLEQAATGERLPWIVVECDDRRAKAYRDARTLHGPDAIILPFGELAAAEAIAGSILRPKTAAARAARGVLVDHQGESEYSVRWQHSPHVTAKVRYDRLADLNGSGIVNADLKTTQDPAPEAFAGSTRKYGYIHALALRDLGAGALGLELAAHFLVAVRSEPPYEVCVFQPQADALTAAHDQLRLELMELEELLGAASEAAWEHSWEQQVQPLTLEEVQK